MVRGCSVSANLIARKTNTGSGNIRQIHAHSAAENDEGQVSGQKGAEAALATHSQNKERQANNRVLGRPADLRGTQPPP